MQKSPSVSPANTAPVAKDGAPEVSSSLLIARRLNRAGLWSALPVLVFCGIGLSQRAPQPTGETLASAQAVEAMRAATIKQSAPRVAIAGVVSADETMVTTLRPANGYSTLQGKLAPAVQVRGEAPIGGRVTQVMVRPGQQVRVGDPVLRVEGKVNAPGSKLAERKQSAAEAVQVAAANQQDALQKKLLARQAKLEKAQQRVNAAQKRVVLARELVRRLSRGENVTRSEVAALATPQLSTRLAARGSNFQERERSALTDAQRREAERDAQQAKKDAKRALEAAAQAQRDAQAALKTAQAKKQDLKDAQALIAKTEAKGATTSPEADVIRGALTEAQAEAKEATDKAEAAQKLAASRDLEAEKLRIAANAADKRLAQLEEPATVISTPAPAATLSADDAAKIAHDALEESADAANDAQRLKREIDSYARQVKSLHAKLTSASENLESAQMAVVESRIAEKLEAVRSPANGVVLDVAEPSSQVTPGETIIAIGRPDLLQIRFEDKSDAWKTLKTGTMLPAVVQPANGKEISVMAELKEVESPDQPGEAAILMTTIENPRAENGRGRQFAPGVKVVCSIPRPGTRQALIVPGTALVTDDKGQTQVAVLSPLTAQEGQPATPTMPAEPAPAEFYRVEWRTVTPGPASGVVREIAGGLRPGERIALRPEPLRQLTQTHGPDAVVKLDA